MNRREALKTLSALLGGTVALPIASGFLAGCRPAPGGGENAQLRALTPARNDVVSAIAELIIPRTDTPGATDAGVGGFIDMMLRDWFSESEKAEFFNGMDAALAFCRDRHGKGFIECPAAEQTALLVDLENEYFANRDDPPPRAGFLHLMKQFTMIGYYTSEVGAGQELRVPVMGHYEGDVPIDESTRAWAW